MTSKATARRMIRWNRSDEGYVTSKCGRYEIEPQFIGRTTPQSYAAFYYPTPGKAADRQRVRGWSLTQADAKRACERDAEWRSGRECRPGCCRPVGHPSDCITAEERERVLTTCNACDVGRMVPGDPRGYCAECAAEADAEREGR